MKRMGPTIVFPKKKVAWGSVTPITAGEVEEEEYVVDVENYWDDETKRQHGLTPNTNQTHVDMVIVPALNGRLLRFDGRAFHAVPKPPHRYLMSKEELDDYLESEEENCQDDNYWDDDDSDDDDQDMERSVLLFNTWPGENSGPRGVLPDRVVVDIPDGIVIEGGVDDAFQRQMEEERRQDWQEEYGDDFESVWCNGIQEWKCVPVERMSSDDRGTIVVPLMGNPSRRGCNFKEDVLKGPINGLEQKFYESERVSLVALKHDTQ
ncbi:hypothetical protein HJC23_011856 [Cyclotella cryptica]|uniref:Uncharacterized protein n=1 Tax=Cyclotella cryptica TaxID=29204 RepID=A0ABD3QDY5_9STRA|eukprot:CCRYP_006169-RA/>CCRYP_006169-RA protein AED:0.10 eAED:0.10 QI:0/-1/0/1/-1/1/1/0/263